MVDLMFKFTPGKESTILFPTEDSNFRLIGMKTSQEAELKTVMLKLQAKEELREYLNPSYLLLIDPDFAIPIFVQ